MSGSEPCSGENRPESPHLGPLRGPRTFVNNYLRVENRVGTGQAVPVEPVDRSPAETSRSQMI